MRSEPAARVLGVNIELCTLHLKETTDLERLLSFCLWGRRLRGGARHRRADGLRLDGFKTPLAADSRELMTWNVRDDGFDMVLSGRVPKAIDTVLRRHAGEVLGGRRVAEIDLWAVHPGGRSVLDAVTDALSLDADALDTSRAVLRENGNMSSATVMFVLERMMAEPAGLSGSAMAFGPGLTTETLLFETAG